MDLFEFLVQKKLTSRLLKDFHRSLNDCTNPTFGATMTLEPSLRCTFSGGDNRSATGTERHCRAMKTRYVSTRISSVYNLEWLAQAPTCAHTALLSVFVVQREYDSTAW